jgi:hypothetical protein
MYKGVTNFSVAQASGYCDEDLDFAWRQRVHPRWLRRGGRRLNISGDESSNQRRCEHGLSLVNQMNGC